MGQLQELLANHDQRKDTRSDLMKLKSKMTNGEKVNACPFGCGIEDLDDNGYCDHLIGFTMDGVSYEPMVVDDRGRRVVQVPMEQVGERTTPKGNKVPILKPVLGKVKKGDKLERITCSSRVYREAGCPEAELPDLAKPKELNAVDPDDWTDPGELPKDEVPSEVAESIDDKPAKKKKS